MKKMNRCEVWDHHALKKIIRMMRIALIFMLVCVFESFALDSYTQSAKISISERGAKLEEVLLQIESQSKYRFAYNRSELDLNEIYTLTTTDSDIAEVLHELFGESSIRYTILGRQIVLSPNQRVTQVEQTITVSGTILNEQNEPLPGVTIAIKGTSTGTITNLDGKYSLPDVPSNAILVYTFVGMKSQEVPVAGKSVIDLVMEEETIGLEEVVAVGYGSVRKTNLTTAQVGVSTEQMEKTVNTTLEQAIQGRAAGVYVTQNSGQPGGGMSMIIRGVSTINGSTEPLYVIDGLQIGGSSVEYGNTSSSNALSGINPSDIEDVQILQGPSATAIYGSRATNGVVIITTKRGRRGEADITYNFSYSVQTTPKHLDVMNLREYAQMVKEFHAIAGGTTPEEFLDPSILGEGTDWQEELFKNAPMQKHQISFSGAGKLSTYYISGEFLNQEGVATGSGFKRYNLRINTSQEPRKWLRLRENGNFRQIKEILTTTQEGVISNALQNTSQVPVKNIDGSWGGFETKEGSNQYAPINPVAIASLRTNENVRRELNGGFNLEADLVKGLVFRTSVNGSYDTRNAIYFSPKMKIGWYVVDRASFSDFMGVSTFYSWDQQLTYNNKFGEHTIDATTLHEYKEGSWKQNTGSRTGFLTNDIMDLNAGDESTSVASGGSSSWAMESYLLRVNYNYNDRYLVQASIRGDGSSNFGANNRWGVFPAGSAAWRISNESWFDMPFMNELKLRFETGLTGNSGGGAGIYSPLQTTATEWGTGFSPSKISNPDLQWEETMTNDLGINIHLFGNRIQIKADIYKKTTNNLIFDASLPGFMGGSGNGGASSPTVNSGKISNKGWEFALNSTNIQTTNFRWDMDFNISGVKTKVETLNSELGFFDRTSWWMNNWTQRTAVGYSPWMFMGYKYDGIFNSVDEIYNSAIPTDANGNRLEISEDGVWVGDVKYKNVGGEDGAEGVIDVNDRTYIGNPWPKFFGGLTNNFTYKGLDLSVMITFNYGNDIYNYVRMVNSNPSQINVGRNLMTDAIDYAKLATSGDGDVYLVNPDTDLPRISYGPNSNWTRFSSRWVEDGSFIRIKNITLGYTVPAALLNKTGFVKSVRLAFSAQNIYTMTKYKGYDPEVGSYVGSQASSANQAIGIDTGRYPLTPTYTFNLMVNF
ncbi:SusC/RagA family TonB-linked outer membrane protein [Mangrovibacterium lignilyticum]|uniref:SusC/RagA family TonB-linked outer membrane protein n=1 Tax=Mangrovibacterium lignilyticum TaxID=2668052 RepID=UPI0013D05C2D|nr:TonB-dependent receptor [Mangrovibacterium lignilyticum]